MKDELISFETAKLAKEKGFDVPVKSYYRIVGSGPFDTNKEHNYNNDLEMETAGGMTYVSAPTQTFLQRWLRKKHKLFVCVHYAAPDTNLFDYRIDYTPLHIHDHCRKKYKEFEEALEVGLQDALKLIK